MCSFAHSAKSLESENLYFSFLSVKWKNLRFNFLRSCFLFFVLEEIFFFFFFLLLLFSSSSEDELLSLSLVVVLTSSSSSELSLSESLLSLLCSSFLLSNRGNDLCFFSFLGSGESSSCLFLFFFDEVIRSRWGTLTA